MSRNLGDTNLGETNLGDTNYIYYIKKKEEICPYNHRRVGYDAKSTDYEIFRDFRESTVVDRIIEILLEYRRIWSYTDIPWDYKYINFSFMGTDIAITPNFVSSLKMVNEKGEVEKTFEVSMKEVFENNKEELVNMWEEKIEKLRQEGLSSNTENQITINKLVMQRSQVSNRITQITRWAGDKSLLYSMMKAYGGKDFIPLTFEMDIDRLREEFDNDIGILNLLETKLIPNRFWVVKPTSGSRGIGMQFASTDEVKENFFNWVDEIYEVKKEPKKFSKWLISELKQSFLWKLKNNVPDSLKLCEYSYENKNGKVVNEKLSPAPEKFKKTGLWNKCRVREPEVIPIKKPSKVFCSHSFNDNDKGRINKARVWFAISIEEGYYKLYVYNKILFELCAKQFEGDYNDKMQLWTDITDEYYIEQYEMDDVNSCRAADLDFCHVIEWENGESFPKNWSKVKENLTEFFLKFMSAVKYRVSCLSSMCDYSKGCFQYFGMDFIVDDNMNVWLLELNTRPWVGYGNWWNKFDPDNVHIPHKWLFLESLLRQFVDPKFDEQPEVLPYGNDLKGCKWIFVTQETFNKVKDPIAVIQKSIPVKGMANWVMTRQIIKTILGRGLSIFPYGKLIKKPELYLQGMTPYIVYLLNKTKGNLKEFKAKIDKMYPDLVKADIVNRIFPFVYYLGNKAVLTDILKDFYNAPGGGSEHSMWLKKNKFVTNQLKAFDIIPASFTINKNNPYWVEELMADIEEYENGTPVRWIVKPAEGKQGTGIYITSGPLDDRMDLSMIVQHILTDPDNQDSSEWVISLYIDNPKLVMDRKSHIRVFVLVNNNGEKVEYYQMEPHLLFLAGLPYERENEFVHSFFSQQGKELMERQGGMSSIQKYKNLTNLSKGKDLFLTYVKRPSNQPSEQIEGYQNPTEVEENLKEKKIWFRNDTLNPNFAYKVLSYDASAKIDQYNEVIKPKIQDLIVHTLYAVKEHVGCVNKGGCYHYLAFDIMVDDNDHPWLLEVNVNPGLQAIKNNLKGGMTNFFNNIFSHVTNNQNLRMVTIKKPQVWVKDGIHYEQGNNNEWYPVEHRKGDPKTYRYSKEKYGKEYDEKGIEKETQYNSDKEWKKGDLILDKLGTKEYYVPNQFRMHSLDWLSKHSRKLIPKYDTNLFTPILKIKKSRERVEEMAQPAVQLAAQPAEVKTEEEALEVHLGPILEQIGFQKVTFIGDNNKKKTSYVRPQIAFALRMAAAAQKAKSELKPEEKEKSVDDVLVDYFKEVFKYMQLGGIFGGNSWRPWMKVSTQMVPLYLKQMLKPLQRGNYRGASLDSILLWSALTGGLKTSDTGRPLEIIVREIHSENSSSFGEINVEGISLEGISLDSPNAIAAIYDLRAGALQKKYSPSMSLPFSFKLPLPDSWACEACEKLSGSGIRGRSGKCDIDDPWGCTTDKLRSQMKRLLKDVPGGKELVNKMKNKDSLICLLGCYTQSGLLGMDFFGSMHPSENSDLMYMFALMNGAGINSMPFKGWLDGMYGSSLYNTLIQRLNMKTGNDFFGVNLANGGLWVPSFQEQVLSKMFS